MSTWNWNTNSHISIFRYGPLQDSKIQTVWKYHFWNISLITSLLWVYIHPILFGSAVTSLQFKVGLHQVPLCGIASELVAILAWLSTSVWVWFWTKEVALWTTCFPYLVVWNTFLVVQRENKKRSQKGQDKISYNKNEQHWRINLNFVSHTAHVYYPSYGGSSHGQLLFCWLCTVNEGRYQ